MKIKNKNISSNFCKEFVLTPWQSSLTDPLQLCSSLCTPQQKQYETLQSLFQKGQNQLSQNQNGRIFNQQVLQNISQNQLNRTNLDNLKNSGDMFSDNDLQATQVNTSQQNQNKYIISKIRKNKQGKSKKQSCISIYQIANQKIKSKKQSIKRKKQKDSKKLKSKQQKLFQRYQFKSSSVGCLFSNQAKPKNVGHSIKQLQFQRAQITQQRLSNQDELMSQKTVPFQIRKKQSKQGYLQQATINYPILQKNSISQIPSKRNTKRQYKSQQQTVNISPRIRQKRKIQTFRVSQSQLQRINNRNQSFFLKPRKQVKSKKDFSKKINFLQTQQSNSFFIRKSSQHLKKLDQDQIYKLIKPIGHLKSDIKINQEKQNKPKVLAKLSLEYEKQKTQQTQKNHTSKIILTQCMKSNSKLQNEKNFTKRNEKISCVQNKLEINQLIRKQINKNNYGQSIMNSNQLCKSYGQSLKLTQSSTNPYEQQALLIQQKIQNHMGKRISINTVQIEIQKWQPIKNIKFKQNLQKISQNAKNKRNINKQNISDQKPYQVKQPSTHIASNKKLQTSLDFNKNLSSELKKQLNLFKCNISQLPKIQMSYQNQAQTKVKRMFQSSKLNFYSRKQTLL